MLWLYDHAVELKLNRPKVFTVYTVVSGILHLQR